MTGLRIVVLGGGFGGVGTARHLERALRGHTGVEITIVSRENFFVITPLLFEACSGRLELRHCAQPIRAALRRARFVEATVESVDVERQIVRAVAAEGATYDLPYDHLVVALGASTNEQLIPGSSNAFTFKTMADALVLRNQLIEQFERADAASEPATRRGCLPRRRDRRRPRRYRTARRTHGIRGRRAALLSSTPARRDSLPA